MKPFGEFKTLCQGVIRIQCFFRMTLCKRTLELKKKEHNERRALEKRMSTVQQTFEDATTLQGTGTVFSVDEGLLDEVET